MTALAFFFILGVVLALVAFFWLMRDDDRGGPWR